MEEVVRPFETLKFFLLLLMGFYIEDQVHKELYTFVHKKKKCLLPICSLRPRFMEMNLEPPPPPSINRCRIWFVASSPDQ